MSERLLRVPAVKTKTGLSRSWLYAAMQAGRFPRPIKVGGIAAWIESEVDAWVAAQIRANRPDEELLDVVGSSQKFERGAS
jgi:prophage regulatory protein